LVIPFTVVVLDEPRNGPAEMTFADRNHSAETLFLDRAHEALRVGIRVGRLKRRLHHADPVSLADWQAKLTGRAIDQTRQALRETWDR